MTLGVVVLVVAVAPAKLIAPHEFSSSSSVFDSRMYYISYRMIPGTVPDFAQDRYV